jgi:DNA-directed RNA polymerase specialized sigma24 family protein
MVEESDPERAVRLLYSQRSQEMFGFARRLGLPDEDASDAVQEAMLRLWRELDAGAEIGDPDAWAFRVLYRVGNSWCALVLSVCDHPDPVLLNAGLL